MAQGRRVRLVIRRIEPLTVLKVAVLFWASIYVILLVAALMLWSAATATGLRENVESFVGDLIAADDFSFKPTQMLRASVVGGALLVALGSFATVMMAVLYNLISDVVGGVAVVFEETAGRGTRRREARKSAKSTSAKSAKPAKPVPAGGKLAAAAATGADDGKATDATDAEEAESSEDAQQVTQAQEVAEAYDSTETQDSEESQDTTQATEAQDSAESQDSADGYPSPGSEPEHTAPGQR